MVERYSHKFDAEAFHALTQLPSNPFHKFLRQDPYELEDARREFEIEGHCPLFSYPEAERFDVAHYLAAVTKLEDRLYDLCHKNATVENLYREKLHELKQRALLIRAVQQKNDEEVTHLSEDLYSQPEESLEDLEAEFERMLSSTSTFFSHTKSVDRESFKAMVRRVLDHYDMQTWSIGSTNRSSILIKHSGSGQPKVLIPETFSTSKSRAARLLTHEIEVHALRTHNGRQSQLLLLGRGLDRYLPTEEGLAIFYQQQAGNKIPRHAPGFWDAYACVLTQNGNFAQTYTRLKTARTELAKKANHPNPEEKGRSAAWRLCLRAYRGIHDTGQAGVGYRRDHVYRSGYHRVTQALSKKGDHLLSILFQGNLGLQHVERLKNLNLRSARLPELISRDVVKSMT